MRLIELRLKNLNSLKGEWYINFNDKAFTDEGIFAITGQTGAGKTTILDAICLALYGETPRINSISKSSNEVMTRQTGECFAEVVIDLDGVQYRCRWGQRRAYGKPDGNLQDATHEVAKVNLIDPSKGDEILEEKLSRTKDKIIELTSMDFQQFTRSILLAQGSFSAFLKAKADERADILEKITGTEIYATISLHVHEKKRAEESKLEQLQASLTGLALLDTDAEASLKEELATHHHTLSEHTATANELQTQIKWLEDAESLRSQFNTHSTAFERAEQAQADFAEEAKRLRDANKALEIEGDYKQLLHLRDSLQKLNIQQIQAQEQRPILTSQRDEQAVKLAEATTHEQRASQALTDALPAIKQTRQLDGDISQQAHSLNEQLERQKTLLESLNSAKQALDSYQTEQTTQQARLDTLNRYFELNPHHQQLAMDIKEIDSNGKQLRELLADNSEKNERSQSLKTETKALQTALDELSDRQDNCHGELESRKKERLDLQDKQDKLLQGQTLSTLRAQQEQLDERIAHINTLSGQRELLVMAGERLTQTSNSQPKLVADAEMLDDKITTQTSTIHTLKAERQDKQDKLELLKQVLQLEAKLEDYIVLLEDNEPCPLCGATEHPYSEHHPALTPSSDNDVESNNYSTKQQQIATEQTINALNEQISEQEQTLATLKIERAKIEQQQQFEHKRIASLLDELHRLSIQTQEVLGDSVELASNNALDKSTDTTTHITTDTTAYISTAQNLSAKLIETLQTETLQTALSTLADDSLASDNSSTDIAVTTTELITALITELTTALSQIENVKPALTEQKTAIKTALQHNDDLVEKIALIDKDIRTLDTDYQSLLRQISDHESTLKLKQQELSHIDTQIAENFADLAQLTATINDLLTLYQDKEQDETNLAVLTSAIEALAQLNKAIASQTVLDESQYTDLLQPLRTQRQTMKQLETLYNTNREQAQQLTRQLDTLATQIDNSKTHIASEEKNEHEVSQRIDTLTVQLTRLKQDRQALFGDKVVEIEEQRLRAEADNAKTNLVALREQHQTYQHKLAQLTEHLEQLAGQITDTSNHLNQQAQSFTATLKQHHFDDEKDFLQARLSFTERDALSNQQQQLNQAVEVAKSALAQTKQHLDALYAKTQSNALLQKLQQQLEAGQNSEQESGSQKPESESGQQIKETLNQELTDIQDRVATLNKQIGAIEQQLANNEANKGEQQSKLDAIAKQKEVLSTWANLHKLIGSADGKKFRTFAQGLTFDIMVGNANTQLQKMSDRYLLIRDDNNPLELNVIDNYQGGEIRSTKNLSGGEGFIISLALALGLSNMASQNIRVDSLFLDEGFGTLDEDSLDIALDTLTNLQQEGKLIGVISHVQALKDRIYTQIKVEKISGGHSQISGAGCIKV